MILLTRNTVQRRVICLIVMPLTIGIGIYALWRGITFIDNGYLYLPVFKKSHMPNFVIYNMPDALYAFALFNTFCLIWGRTRLLWCSILFLTLVASELFQRWHIISGTFDWFDIVAYVVAFFAVFIEIQIIQPLNNNSL